MAVEVILDFSDTATDRQLHAQLKSKFGFPDYYGANWDAFWDCISVDVEMPDRITILGTEQFKGRFERSYDIMRRLLRKYVAYCRPHKVVVDWR